MSFLAGHYVLSSDRLLPPDAPFERILEASPSLRVVYDYALLERTLDRSDFGSGEEGLRRFDSLLPLRQWSDEPPLRLSATPHRRLSDARLPAGTEVILKDESTNPTGSVRDRATVLALNHARVLGRGTLVGPGKGNLGTSLAGLVARASLNAVVVSSGEGSGGIHPAPDVSVREREGTGPGEDVSARRLARAAGWYDRSPLGNPYLLEAYKTIAFELFESGDVPDTVLYEAREGTLGNGLRKGFQELHQLGWIPRLPRFVAVRPDRDARGNSVLNPGYWSDSVDAPIRPGRSDGVESCQRPDADRIREAGREVEGLDAPEGSAAACLAALRKLVHRDTVGPQVAIVARGTRREPPDPDEGNPPRWVEAGDTPADTLDRIRPVLGRPAPPAERP